MKTFLMIVGGLVLAGIAAVVIVAMVAGKKFEPYAEAILKDCEAGAYDKAYAATSQGFQKVKSLEEFRGMMQQVNGVLGAWKSVTKRTGGGMSTSSDKADSGSVNLVLAYERGPAEAVFEFIDEEGKWKMSGFKITWDPKLAPDQPPADPTAPR